MEAVIIVARVLHIGGAIFWVGSVMLAVFFLEPTARALGASGSTFMAHLIGRRRLTAVMGVAAVTSIGAGTVLYWIVSGGLRLEWIITPSGLAFSAGAVAALGAFMIAFLTLKPGFDRAAALAEQAIARSDWPSESVQIEIERIEARLRPWGLVQVVLLGIAVVTMATGRYLR